MSTSPGLKAKFSDDGSKLIVTGQSKGNVTLRLKWDDNPVQLSVGQIKINGTQWTQSGRKVALRKRLKSSNKSTCRKFEQRTPLRVRDSLKDLCLKKLTQRNLSIRQTENCGESIQTQVEMEIF